MKILFLSPWFPNPPVNGSKIRVYNLIKALSNKHEVKLISFVREGEQIDPKGLEGICKLEGTVPWKEFAPNSWRSILGFFSPTPRSIIDTYCPQMTKQIQRSIAEQYPDILIASQINTAFYVSKRWGIPCIYDEVELGKFSDNGSTLFSSNTNFRNQLTRAKTQAYTRRLMKQFDACTIVSDNEQELLMKVLNRNVSVHVVPNGVDIEYNRSGIAKPQPNTLIYNGALTYNANFDAMEYFIREIFPLIQVQVPEVTLKITGSTQGVDLSSIAINDNIKLTGLLSDIRPAVAESWACVVPLRQGGGTRLKILEAMALGTPIIATTKAAEGLKVTDGKDLLIADSPDEFAEQTIRLLKDLQLRNALASNARQLVENNYGWDAIGSSFDAIVENVLSEFSNRVKREQVPIST